MTKIHAAITSVGGYVPDYVLTNKELEVMVDTNDEWITTRTGIKERRILKGERATSDMGAAAALDALKKRNIDPLELDLIICGTVTQTILFHQPQTLFPIKLELKTLGVLMLMRPVLGFYTH